MSERHHLEFVNCNLCGHDNTRLLYSASSVRRNQSHEFNLVKCCKCGLVYTNPRPEPRYIIDYYPKDYEYHEVRNISFLEKLYYKYFRNPGIKKGKILDVGCGNGNYLFFLKKKGWDCYGTEINDFMINHIVNNFGLKIFKGDLYDISFPDEYFDVITFWGSLEHMSNPLKVLAKTHRLLKPDGKIIIWFQNIDALEARTFRKYWHHLEVPIHYYQFSAKTLTDLLERIGFKIERVKFEPISMGIIPSLGYLLNIIGIKINLNRLIIKIIFIPLDILLSLLKTSGLVTIYAKKLTSIMRTEYNA